MHACMHLLTHACMHTCTRTHTHTGHPQVTGQKRVLYSIVSLFFLHFYSNLTSHFPTSQNTISSKQTHPPTHMQSNSSRIKPEKVQCVRYCTSNRQHCTSRAFTLTTTVICVFYRVHNEFISAVWLFLC